MARDSRLASDPYVAGNATVLRATPVRLFSWDFRITDGVAELATLDVELFRARARFELDGVPHRVDREGLLTGRYALYANDEIVARAERTSLVPYESAIIGADRRLTLRRAFGLRIQFRIMHGDIEVGRILRPSLLSRALLLEMREATRLELRLFALTLAVFAARRRARRSS